MLKNHLKVILYFLLTLSNKDIIASDTVLDIKNYDVVRNYLLFSMGLLQTTVILGGISYALSHLIEKYGIIKLQEKLRKSTFGKKYAAAILYLKYLKYLAFLPALIDLKKKMKGMGDFYQSAQAFSPRVRDFTSFNQRLSFKNNSPNMSQKVPSWERSKHLLFFGAHQFDNIPKNIMALYSTNYISSLSDNKYNEVALGATDDGYGNVHAYLDWGNYVSPEIRAQKIKESVPLLRNVLAGDKTNTKDRPFYLVGESYGGIVAINTLYELCQNEKDYNDLKNKHIIIITNSSPYNEDDIKKLTWLMENMPNMKIVGLIKFDDSIPNKDPFPDKAVNTFLIRHFYDTCVKNNNDYAKRILIAALWHKKEAKKEGEKDMLEAIDHNEYPFKTYRVVYDYINKHFIDNTDVLPVEHFIIDKKKIARFKNNWTS